MRRNLGKALRATGNTMVGVVEVMTGDLNEDGRLEAATGETHERIGIDAGLYPLLQSATNESVTAGSKIQVGAASQGRWGRGPRVHLVCTERVDVWGRQHGPG